MRDRDARYVRAQAIAHEVLNLSPDQHSAELDTRCGDEPELRGEVEWLIAAAGDAGLDPIPAVIADTVVELGSDLHIDATAPGRYRLLERLGEGGMGVVWLAERETGGARQRVALKRLRASSVAQQARFHEEQRILATLNHPNIAHLVDTGTDAAGEPFLAMEYVQGRRIDLWCDTQALDLRARIRLFLKVCAAVSYAHQRLVIHRDLKPANVLVDARGEPRLLDFGIARLLGDDAQLATATQVMTPAYASPEQIDGKPLGTATDLWSLGVMLYELLTGVRPFEQFHTDHARAAAILSGVVTPPSRQPPRAGQRGTGLSTKANRIATDLDAILLKALRREPEQRYGSVQQFADDLDRFLAGRPVQAQRGRWSYRALRFVQRNRWSLTAGSVLLAVSAGFTWRVVLAEREARLQAEVAERTTQFLISTFSLSDPSQAGRNDFSAREVLDRGRERVDEELSDQPRVRARLLEALGNAYLGINEGSAGAPLLEAAAALYLDPAVRNPLAAARSLRAKVRSINSVLGTPDEAAHTAQRAFELVREHAGDDLLALADAYGTLAEAPGTGTGHDALQAAQQALALREAAGAGPLVIAQSMLQLCRVTSHAGDFIKAIAWCEQAQARYTQAGAARSNGYRMTLRQLESTLAYGGDYVRGLTVAREELALTRELFGEDSAALANERVSLTDRLAEHGLFDEAAASLAAGMPVVLRRNGANSAQYARAMFQSGWLKVLQGEFDLAVPPLREALAIHEAIVQGHDRNRLHVLRTSLATALIESGRTGAEARNLLEAVIASRTAMGGGPHFLAYARLPLARWHVLHGEHDTALALLDQVDAAGAGVEAELHARAAATRSAILQARADSEGALVQAQSAYEIILRDRGRENPRTAYYALAYARALRSTGESTQADVLQREYQPKLERAYPPGSAFRRLLIKR